MTNKRKSSENSINTNLHAARSNKNDEFYTRLNDVSDELHHYRKHFKDKVVYCNCDDPYVSAFFEYFSKNFEALGLKKLIATCYKSQKLNLFSEQDSERAIKLVYEGGAPQSMPTADDIGVIPLNGDGDFRSDECVALLKEADIVVTNPPFSLFREYMAQLIEHEVKFLVVGNMNAISYKEVFPLIKANKIWLGYKSTSSDMYFHITPAHADRLVATKKEGSAWVRINGEVYGRLASAIWFTNLDHDKRHRPLDLYKLYCPEDFPSYDNYDAIEVSRVADIPEDWDGAMGVPITFLDRYCPDQFEILGITDRDNNSGIKIKEYDRALVPNASDLNRRASIKLGPDSYKSTYVRILIRKKP